MVSVFFGFGCPVVLCCLLDLTYTCGSVVRLCRVLLLGCSSCGCHLVLRGQLRLRCYHHKHNTHPCPVLELLGGVFSNRVVDGLCVYYPPTVFGGLHIYLVLVHTRYSLVQGRVLGLTFVFFLFRLGSLFCAVSVHFVNGDTWDKWF